ncbi:MAG: FtsX-like permease family protein [Gemmataceae bacterium]
MLALYRTLSVRHLRRRFGRAALVVVSIALGVATLVSARVLNRCMEAAVRSATAPLGGTADLFASNGEAGVERALAVELRRLPGVKSVQPLLLERVQLPDLDGRVALLLGAERPEGDTSALAAKVTITRPAALFAKYPVLLGEDLARELGDRPLHVRTAGRDHDLSVLGTIRLDGAGAEIGKSLIALDLDRAGQLFGRPALVSRIDLFLAPDADRDAVKRAAADIAGSRALVQTPDAAGQSVNDIIAGVQTGFALCGGGALVVGVFLVYNALAVSVAERRHEIGVMRSLGATRAQVAALFAGEAAFLGLAGALAGLPLGMLLARAALRPMQQVLSEIFMAVEQQAVTWDARILLGSLAAGVVTALVASLLPALQAASDEPADAVRRVPSGSARLYRVVQGGVSLAMIGLGVMTAVLRDAMPLRLGSYGGLVLMLAGALLAAPVFVAVGARLVLPLVRLLPGVGVRLAADNLLRAPGRTGVVIGALAAGVGMTSGIAGVAESNERPVLDWVDRWVSPDFFVMGGEAANTTSGNLPLDTRLGEAFEALPGVAHAVPVRFRRPTFRDTLVLVIAFDGVRFHAANLKQPDYPALDLFPKLVEPGTAIVSDNFATLHGVRPGDAVRLQGPRGPVELRVLGTMVDYSWNRGTVFIDRATLKAAFDDDGVDLFDVFLAAGDRAVGEAGVRALAGRNALTVVTRTGLRDYITGVIRRLYALVQVQQLVVGLVAGLGVVTALLISVLQRRRELGLLRAVGATRAQVLRSVVAEAALMGLIGTAFGLLIGVPLNWYMVRVVIFEESGFVFPVVVPWLTAAAIGAASVVFATAAGLFPAWRATRLGIADAVVYE